MHRSIIAAVDGSPEATGAARAAAELARLLDRRLILAFVANDPPVFPYGEPASRELERRRALQRGAAVIDSVAANIGRPAYRRRIPFAGLLQGSVAEQLASLAREENADLLLLGSRARGPLGAALLGSVSDQIAKISECPIIVVPPQSAASGGLLSETGGTIVCGVDGTVGSERAQLVAEELAESLDSTVRPVFVDEADPTSGLAEAAYREAATLIVVGTRGHGGLTGSVAQRLTLFSPVPVLIVPPDAYLPSFRGGARRQLAAAA
jgi:nucleotide-binding universal stress UspA family protein